MDVIVDSINRAVERAFQNHGIHPSPTTREPKAPETATIASIEFKDNQSSLVPQITEAHVTGIYEGKAHSAKARIYGFEEEPDTNVTDAPGPMRKYLNEREAQVQNLMQRRRDELAGGADG